MPTLNMYCCARLLLWLRHLVLVAGLLYWQVCCSGRVAAVSTVVTVVVHASAVCTIAVAVDVIVIVM